MCPGRGSASAPTFRGAGQVGVDFLGLVVSWGGAPLVLEKAGRVGLSNEQTVTLFFFFNSKILTTTILLIT